MFVDFYTSPALSLVVMQYLLRERRHLTREGLPVPTPGDLIFTFPPPQPSARSRVTQTARNTGGLAHTET